MIRLLSTRVLEQEYKNRIPGHIDYREYDAIQVRLLSPSEHTYDSDTANDLDPAQELALFTSRNAVRALFENPDQAPPVLGDCFCVGEKTAALLRQHGQQVVEVADQAKSLATIIVSKYNNRSFVHFCGNRRLNVLSDILGDAGIPLRELVVYETVLQHKSFSERFDRVMFFSPSGVESFVKNNTLSGVTAVCIGPTTARAARLYTDRIIIASKPGVAQVVEAASGCFES